MTKNNKKESIDRFKGLTKASILAISVDILLISLKYILANLTGNPVLLADVLHSSGDLAITLSVMVSIFINFKFPNNKFARHAEGIVALFIAFFLILGSSNLIIGVLFDSSSSYVLNNDIELVIAIAGITIAIAVTFYMSLYKRRIGEKFNSFAFKAESKHTFSDFLTSLGIWVTLIFGYFGIHFEKFTTLIVGLIVIKIGFSLFFQALKFFDLNEIINFLEKIIKIIYEKLEHLLLKLEFVLFSDLKKIIKNIPTYFDEKWVFENKFKIIKWNIIFIILLYLGTGFYLVKPSQTALNFIFGTNNGKDGVGIHYNFPKPIGQVKIVDSELVLRVESGFRFNEKFAGVEPDINLWELSHSNGKIIKNSSESISLTGDENIVDSNFLCYYKIKNSLLYSMKIENSKEILRNILTFEIHSTLAHHKIEDILTSARGKIQLEIKNRMIKALTKIDLGVEILNVYMLSVHPPIEVVPKYRAVASAREKKDEIIFKSETYVNDLLPKSRGKSKASIINAELYAVQRLNLAQGETTNYNLRQRNFNYGIAINRSRMWWENVEKVLKGKSIYILPHDIKKRFYSTDRINSKKNSLGGFDK